MEIIIGSKNPTKIKAVEAVFTEAKILSIDAHSKVSAQPKTDSETRIGAVNRAIESAHTKAHMIGIGLEGGIMYIDDDLYLCSWGALVTPDGKIYTASGARIPLPKEIEDALDRGGELSDVIDRYTNKKDIRNNQGTIGIFTAGLISRQEMFAHIIRLLRGQWLYDQDI